MIYFIQIAVGGPIKIGVSNSPCKRLQELQTSNPCKLELVGVMEGEREQEQKLHQELKEFRIIPFNAANVRKYE